MSLEFLDPIGDDESRLFFKRRGIGEERSGMTVGTHAKEDEVKAWEFARLKVEKSTQLAFIVGGSSGGIGIFCEHAKDVFRWDDDLGEQRFLDHPIIAFGVGGRDVAFVAEENKDAVPAKVG